MFYYLAQFISDSVAGTELESWFGWLRLFKYITFRGACAAITALLLSLYFGPRIIEWLKRVKISQQYADRAAEMGNLTAGRIDKRGTPTMGGLMIVAILDFTALLWTQWNTYVQLTLLAVIVLCGLGFWDDYLKVTRQNSKGTKGFIKLYVQGGLAAFTAVYLWLLPSTSKLISEVMVPFVKEPVLVGSAGVVVGIIITTLAIVGTSNAVNLTDGLDGLAIGCVVIVSFVFLVATYIAGHAGFAKYLQVPYVNGAGELTVFCAAMIGTGLGFLWFNCYPAMVFMGDTGSLALGGVLGIISVLIHQPLLIAIAGGIFVVEAGSVIIQTSYFKYTRKKYGEGRRIFKMAPIHHHFEKLGWTESQVVTRFYILCVLFAVLALATFKVR